jgi:hypothetical protein
MNRSYSRRTLNTLLGVAPLIATGLPARAQLSDAVLEPSPETAARDLAIEAYIFGYPLVTMEITRRMATNAAKPEGLHGPMGQFANAREYPTTSFDAAGARFLVADDV